MRNTSWTVWLSWLFVLGIGCQPVSTPTQDTISIDAWEDAQESLAALPPCPAPIRLDRIDLAGKGLPNCPMPAQWYAWQDSFRQHLDARYVDAAERLLYNSWAAQGNVLPAPRASLARWQADERLYLLHFLPYLIQDTLVGQPYALQLETDFPREGVMRWTLTSTETADFPVMLRIPGWADNQPSPNPAYRYWHKTNRKLTLSVDGTWIFPRVEKGFAHIEQNWSGRHVIELRLPLAVRKIIQQDPLQPVDSFALGWGPLLYGLAATEAVEPFSTEARWTQADDSRYMGPLQFDSLTPGLEAWPYQTLADTGTYWLPVRPQ